jgi:hypothetical protein
VQNGGRTKKSGGKKSQAMMLCHSVPPTVSAMTDEWNKFYPIRLSVTTSPPAQEIRTNVPRATNNSNRNNNNNNNTQHPTPTTPTPNTNHNNCHRAAAASQHNILLFIPPIFVTRHMYISPPARYACCKRAKLSRDRANEHDDGIVTVATVRLGSSEATSGCMSKVLLCGFIARFARGGTQMFT